MTTNQVRWLSAALREFCRSDYFRIIEISWHKCEYVGELVEIRDKHFERGNCFLDISETAFRASRELGCLSPRVDPRTAAIGLMAVVDGLVANWTLDRSSFPLVDTGTEIIDGYFSGLRARRPDGAADRNG